MDRDKFLNEKRLPIRRGQHWKIINAEHAKYLLKYIEIVEIKKEKVDGEEVVRCKIKELFPEGHRSKSRWAHRLLGPFEGEVTEFMLAGDILTFYEYYE